MLNTARNLLIMPNNVLQMLLKLVKKEQFKKQQKQPIIWLVTKLQIKQQNTSETVASEKGDLGFDAKIPKERYIPPEKSQKIID